MARGRKTGGRRKGTPNKITGAVKEAIEEAFANAGGVAYLEKVAQDDPRAFCTLLGKILPKQVEQSGPDGEPLSFVVEFIPPTNS